MICKMSTRVKRVVAFLIDWNLGFIPAFVLTFLLSTVAVEESLELLLVGLIMVVFCLSLALIAFRDFVFGGRSIGKRIFGLVVVDKDTMKKAAGWKIAFRGIFFFLYYVDGVLMLASGKSIGDMAFGTLVLSQKELAETAECTVDEKVVKSPTSSKKTIIAVVSVFVALVLCFLVVVCLAIKAEVDTIKQSEEHAVAYEYLVSSQTFKESGLDPKNVKMSSYSYSSETDENRNKSETAEFGFRVKFGVQVPVTCHRENGTWIVCKECTPFE